MVAYLSVLGDWSIDARLYMISLALVVITQRKHAAIMHMALGFMAIKGLELIVFEFVATSEAMNQPIVWVNQNIYITHLLVDALFMTFLLYRPFISRRYLYWLKCRPTTSKELTYTRAETLLITVTAFYLVVDMLAIIENLIRNLEHVGVNEAFAKQFWHWTWIFDNYSLIKQILNVLEFLLIWSVINRMGRLASESFLFYQSKKEQQEYWFEV